MAQSSSPTATLTTLVVDDEQLAREELMFLLKSIPGVEVVAAAGNGLEAVELIEEHQPDLVFLDVQMPGFGRAGCRTQAG